MAGRVSTSSDESWDDLEDSRRAFGSRNSHSSSSSLEEIDAGPVEDGKGPVFEFVKIHPELIVELREALRQGDKLKAAYDVGDFIEGAQLLAGGDLNLEALDIYGLNDGDELDHRLEPFALEAIACLADDAREVTLAMRPVYVVQELAEKAKKERADHSFAARAKQCCIAFMRSCCARRKWRRRRRCRDRIRGCMRSIEACFLKLCFSRGTGGIEKRYDVFLACEMQDRDLAHWIMHFCQNRSWTVYADPPCEQVRKFLKRQREKNVATGEDDDGKKDDLVSEADDDDGEGSGGATARTGTSSGSGRSKTTNIPCLEWLRRRRTAIGASQIFIVILNNECFENAFVVQDCVWAYANGIPILPISRDGSSTSVSSLRRQLPCAFRLGLGVPSAGPGANRHKLSGAIARAIVKSLLTARYANSRHHLPKGAKNQFIFSCKKLQVLCKQGRLEEYDQFLEAEEEGAAEEGEEEKPAVDQEEGEEEKKSGEPEEEEEEEEAMDKKATAAGEEQLTLNQLREQAEKEHALKAQEEEARKEYEARMERLSLEHEERVYGIVAALALHGAKHQQVTIEGVDAIRRVSRMERGCITLAEFSGVTIVMRCAHTANRSKGRTDRRGKRGNALKKIKNMSRNFSKRLSRTSSRMSVRVSARITGRISAIGMRFTEYFGLGAYEDLGGERKVTRCQNCRVILCSIFCICCICCCRRKKKHHHAKRSSSVTQSDSETPPKKGCLRRLCCCFFCCCRKQADGSSAEGIALYRETCGDKSKRCCFFFCLRCCIRKRGVRFSVRPSQVPGAGKSSVAEKEVHPDEMDWDEVLDHLPCCVRRPLRCLDRCTSILCCRRKMKFGNTRMSRFTGDNMKRLSYMTTAFASIFTSKAAKHIETMGIAENSLACLRNLACRSTERKSEILNSGGAIIAVKAMKVFADTEGDGVKKAAAGLLRNLSAEVHRGPPILYQAGVLSVAREELAEATVTTDTERHLLATVQNMAAHPDAAISYFRGGDSERWLSICAQVVENAKGSKATKILQQALSALANLARVRTVESQVSGNRPESSRSKGRSHSAREKSTIGVEGPDGTVSMFGTGFDKDGFRTGRSSDSVGSKGDSKAVTAEDQNDDDSQAGDAKPDAEDKAAAEKLTPLEARKKAALRAAAAAEEEQRAKPPPRRKTVKGNMAKKGRKSKKRKSRLSRTDTNKHMHEGLSSTMGQSEGMHQKSTQSMGWGDSEGEEAEGDGLANQCEPKRRDSKTKHISGEASLEIASFVKGQDEEDAKSDASGDKKSEEDEDEGHHEGEESEEEHSEGGDNSVIGSDDEKEHDDDADDVEQNSSDESRPDVEFHSEVRSSDRDEDEDLEELEEEGGEEEEKVNDEIVEAEDEEKDSLPTDTREYDLSLEFAREKVPEKVLESMLHLLNEECEKREERRSLSQASALTVAATIAALCNFAQDVDVERSIGALSGLETVLNTMIAFDDSQVHLQGLRFFLNMSFSHHNQERLIQAGVLPFIFDVLQQHRTEDDAEIQEQGCGLLRNLATGPARQKAQIFRQGATKMVVRTLLDYPAHPGACRQAAAAIRILADGAPPVADEVCEADGMAALIIALRKTGDDPDLTEQVLHAMEFVLVTPRARRPFCKALGHLDVLNSMERFTMSTTVLRACRTLAGAMCITQNFTEQDLSDSEEEEALEEDDDELLIRAGGSTATRDQLKKEREEKKKRKKEEGPMRRKPSFRMRLDLAEQGAVDKLCNHLEVFSEHLDVLEAVLGSIRNLILDLPGMKNMGLKQTVGSKAALLVRTVSLWVDRPETRREAMRFTALMFTLLASLALNSDAAIMLHRQQAAEKALEWMSMYHHDAPVQCTGCAFLKNFAGSLLRVRAEIVECGGVRQISEILQRFLKNPQVIQEAIRALHNFAMADGCGEEAAENLVVRRTLTAVHEHNHDVQLNAVGFALLWNISTTNIVASAIVVQDGVKSALRAITSFHDEPQVIGNCGGLLRNLLAGEHKEVVSHTISKSGMNSYCLLRDSLYRHSYSALVAEQLLGCLSNIAIMKGEHLDILANEMMTPKEADSLLNLLEALADQPAVQYQGFSLIARLVSYDRSRKRAFNIIVPHALMMLVVFRNSPVVDMIEACMEEVG